MTGNEASSVTLAPVDDSVLQLLVHAAVTDATADDVTPPLTPGPSWTAARVAWLRTYHRRCRDGLAGPAGEATWAVIVDSEVVGSVRLKNTGHEGVVETGIWLTRTSRGRGIGRQAMTAVLREALLAGAHEIHADTTASNAAAQSLLRSLAFDITGSGNALKGSLELRRR